MANVFFCANLTMQGWSDKAPGCAQMGDRQVHQSGVRVFLEGNRKTMRKQSLEGLGATRSPRSSERLPLGARRRAVYTRVREQVVRGEYAAMEKIIKQAMMAGQGSAVVCRLTAERDYTFTGCQDRRMGPRRKSLMALDKREVDLNGGSFWMLREPWEALVAWLKRDQGLEWDLSFIVIGNSHDPGAMEATHADLLVSWPPYTVSEVGRVRGPLLTYWEDKCIRKTVQVSDGTSRWKTLFKNALGCGQSSAIIQTVYLGHDFNLVGPATISAKLPELVCAVGARCWLSNAPLPAAAVEDGAYWVMEPRYKSLLEWVKQEQLGWYLVFDVEVDPTSKQSVEKARLRRLKDLLASHMDQGASSISLSDADRFIAAAAKLDPLPLRYCLSKWAYFVITDYPVHGHSI